MNKETQKIHIRQNISTLRKNIGINQDRFNSGEINKETYLLRKQDAANALRQREEELGKLSHDNHS